MPQLTVTGWYHVFLFGGVVPYLAIKSHTRMKNSTAPIDRLRHFQRGSLTLVIFAVLSLLTALKQHLWWLFHVDSAGVWKGLPAAIAIYVAAVVIMKPQWRKAVEQRKRVASLFMPENAIERAWWITVATLAGVSEEITWRGVQTTLLAILLGNFVVASIVCAVMFGLAHFMQGWKSMGIVVLFALVFQALVWLSGTLLLAMAVHAAYDITAGLNYGRMGRELGYSA
jgi:hypothetical protein